MEREFIMAKRSKFERRPQDAYQTIDPRAMWALLPHLKRIKTFAEPCAGEGRLVELLEQEAGLRCVLMSDIGWGIDALQVTDFRGADAIITNPPWTREIMHKMIRYFQARKPTWLLMDADWAHNVHAAPFLENCSDIVSVGRLKWIEGSNHSGKDNCAWYRFWIGHTGVPRFHPRRSRKMGKHQQVSLPGDTPAAKPTPVALVEEYIKLRDDKKRADEVYTAWVKENYAERMGEIEVQLLDKLNELGAESIAGKSGTAYKKLTTSVTIADMREFRRHVIGSEQFDLADWRANKTVIEEMVERDEQLPPGVNRTAIFTIGIRRK